MKKLGVVLVMGHFPELLMPQKGPKRVHKIPLEVDQQENPSTWYDGIPGRAQTAIPIKIKTSTTISDVDNIPLSKRLKRGSCQL
jgi:hypothetical protein